MKIVKYPHPTLRHKSKPLRKVDAELKRMVREMFELMYENNGVGLAANQVDLPYRLFVMNVDADSEATDKEMVFINPVITKRKGQAEDSEGCLSFPEIWAPVSRSAQVTVEAYDLSGKPVSFEMEGLYARAVQHEIDHLDGVVFPDRLSPTALMEIRADLEELQVVFESDQEAGRIPSNEQIAARLAELERQRT